MTFALAYWVALCLFWAFIQHIVGAPGLLQGPWTLERMAALKHQELSCFWLLNIGIPVVAVALTKSVEKAGPFLTERSGRFFDRLSRGSFIPLLPWLFVGLLIQKISPGARELVWIPGILSGIFLLVLLTLDLKNPRPLKRHSVISEPVTKDLAPTSGHRSRWSRLFWYGVIPLMLFCGTSRTSVNYNNVYTDDGLRLAAFSQYEQGATPYRDIFFQYGPGIELAEPWVAFHLMGPHWISYRQLSLYLEPLGTIAAYVLALSLVEQPLFALLLAFIFLFRMDLWVSYRMTLPFLSVLACTEAFRRPERAYGFMIGGVLCGLALFHSMESGLLPPPAIIVFLMMMCVSSDTRAEALKHGIHYLTGMAIVLFPAALWLIWNHAFGAFIQNTFLVGSTLMSGWGKPTPILRQPLLDFLRHPWSIYGWRGVWERWWLPFVLYNVTVAWSLYRLITRQWYRSLAPLLMVALLGIFYELVILGRTDYEHWLKGVAPFWILGILLLDKGYAMIRAELRRATIRRWTIAFPAAAMLIFLPILIRSMDIGVVLERLRAQGWWVGQTSFQTSKQAALPDIRYRADQEKDLREILDALHRNVSPREFFYVFSDDSLFYFLLQGRNPTRYANLHFVIGDRMVQEVLCDLKHTSPRVILGSWNDGHLECAYYQKPIADFIETHYHITEHIGSYVILVRTTQP